LAASQCEVAMRFASRLGLGSDVQTALGQLFERWDGRGQPRGLLGSELSIVTRVMQVGYTLELALHALEPLEAAALLRARARSALDPEPVSAALNRLPRIAELSAGPSVYDELATRAPLDPTPACVVDEVPALFADFADLKSVFRLGHSSGVASLAASAAQYL